MDGPQIIGSGTHHLASDEELETQRREGKERTLDIRFIRLLAFINEKIAQGVQRIVFEDVTFSGSPMQNQLWAGLRAAIWAAALPARVSVFCVPVTTLKVYATGNTRADKSEMAKALIEADPGVYELNGGVVSIRESERLADDNEVDAIWLARFAAAVDSGERDFLTAYQRKIQKREKRRASRRAAKAARKARKARKWAEAREKKKLLRSAIKAMGRCCGVLRRPSPRGLAICPKCATAVKIPRAADKLIESPVPAATPEQPMPMASGS